VSWDIFVQHLPADATSLDEIPDDFSPPPIGSRENVICQILSAIPSADFSDPAWGLIDGPTFSIEVSLGREQLNGFALHVRGDDSVVPVVAKILAATGLRGIDRGTGEIFSEEAAVQSLRKWRRYRDQVAEERGGG